MEAGRFRVWAPNARRVEVELSGGRAEMRPCAGGWWETEAGTARRGDDYRFVVDGGEPLADARSRLQPEGAHGPSRVVDDGTFAWSDGAWRGIDLDRLLVYEMHVGAFTEEGTLDAAVRRLDHLVSLGVTAVELMPLADFPGGRGWGYDGVHLWAVHRAYGGPEGLRRFVDACHARGLGVVVDVVYNHVGPDGCTLPRFGPYFTDRYRTPWGDAFNLDGPLSDEVRAFLVENALMWLRAYHVDGLRLDAVHAIIDTSAVHILEELSARVVALGDELGRRLIVIAETDRNDPRVVRPRQVGGHGCDAQWSDDYHHALWAALTGERDGYYQDFGPLAQVATALEDGVVFSGQVSGFRRRRHGRAYDGVDRRRLLGYIQDHDQVGNRAFGERSAALLDLAALRAAAALGLCGPFTPMLFMGEEWGATTPFLYFTDHTDPELARRVREGRRREFAAFGWPAEEIPDPQDPATFERSRLDWAEPAHEPHAGLLEWHRRLIRLRRDRADLREGRPGATAAAVDAAGRSLAMRRGGVVVAWNLGGEPVDVGGAAPRRALLCSPGVALGASDGEVRVPPGGTLVWEAEGDGRPVLAPARQRPSSSSAAPV